MRLGYAAYFIVGSGLIDVCVPSYRKNLFPLPSFVHIHHWRSIITTVRYQVLSAYCF